MKVDEDDEGSNEDVKKAENVNDNDVDIWAITGLVDENGVFKAEN